MNRRLFFTCIAQAVAIAPVAVPIIAKVSERGEPWYPELSEHQKTVFVGCGNLSRASITPFTSDQIKRVFVASVFYGTPIPHGVPMGNLTGLISYRSSESLPSQLDIG